MPLLIVSAFLDYLAAFFGLISGGTFIFLGFRLFVVPALKIRAKQEAPPEEGYQRVIVFKDRERMQNLSLGQLHSDINFCLRGVREEHLTIQLRKEPDLEEYDISLRPGGIVFFRPAHSRKYKRMKSKESFTSGELLGYPAALRLAVYMVEGRPLHYIELELSNEYFYDLNGQERMKFILSVVKIYPPVDIESRNKKGIYLFSSSATEQAHKEELS